MAFFIHPDGNTSEVPNSVYVNISNERLLCNEIYVNDTQNGTRTKVFPILYMLDLNGAENCKVDVYINGSLVASDVSDYYEQVSYGATYEFKNIRANSGYTYNGVSGGSLSGTITGTTVTTLNVSVVNDLTVLSASVSQGWAATFTETSRNTTYVPSNFQIKNDPEFEDRTQYIYTGEYTKLTITFYVNNTNSYEQYRYVEADVWVNGNHAFFYSSEAYVSNDSVSSGYHTYTYTVPSNSNIPIRWYTDWPNEEGAGIQIGITSIVLGY